MGRPLEEEMLERYLAERVKGSTIYKHVRLSKPPLLEIPGLDPEKARRMAMPGLPEVDAIIVESPQVTLIEAKIAKFWENLGKIIIYRHLLPRTPGWEGIDMSQVRAKLVMAAVPSLGYEVAKDFGVEVDTYMTPRAYEILTKGWPSQRR